MKVILFFGVITLISLLFGIGLEKGDYPDEWEELEMEGCE